MTIDGRAGFQADLLTYALWIGCRHHPRSKDLMLSSCGHIATAVGMGPLKGMSREMAFVRSGLQLGLISPINMQGIMQSSEPST